MPRPMPLRRLSRPGCATQLNYPQSAVISVDARGVIEYWGAGGDYGAAKDLKFRFKMDTDLYNLAKA